MKFIFSLKEIIRAKLTIPAPMPQQAATAKMLNTAEPTMVPMPMSPSVMNVPITFTKSSGADVAAAMNVAPATSLDIFKAVCVKCFEIHFLESRRAFLWELHSVLPVHIFSTAGTKYLSQTTASARNKYKLHIA